MENTENAPELKKDSGSPYKTFMWGGLIMAVLCFGLASHRLAIKRPARADAYVITGILGLLSAAMAWSLGAAHARSLRSQQSLQESLDRLQDRMHDMPRSLMEESVKVAERESAGRRADQERQARELRAALEDGIRAGFAPLAPALSERIEASLSGLADSLRQDREERASGLRDMAGTIASLQGAQKEWAQASAGLLEKLREQGSALQKEISERDAGRQDAFASGWKDILSEARAHFERTSEALNKGLAAAAESAKAASAGAETRLQGNAEQAQAWLTTLSAAAGNVEQALEGVRRGGEESAAQQAAWSAAVESFGTGLSGMLDRLQSFAKLAEGQEAVLEKMGEAIRRFEERSAELLEETALKAQESLLDALDQAGARGSAVNAGEEA